MKQWHKTACIIAGAMTTLFLTACCLLMFRPQLFMRYDPNEYDANGLYGNVSDLFFINKHTGIALSSLTHPDHPDSIKIFHTSDAGHNWLSILELPGYSHAYNAIKIDNNVFCIVNNESNYTLLSIDITSGKHNLSTVIFHTLPILFEHESKLGYAVNGVFYITDSTFSTIDSIGSYNKKPANNGMAVINGHIYGFIFDKDSCVSRLYDFIDNTTIGHLATPGDASLIKTTDRSCLIFVAQDQQNFVMYDFDGIKKTLAPKATYAYHMIQALKIDNDTPYTLVSEAPNTDYYLLIGDTSWQSNTILNLYDSNIKAYCLIDNTFYYYNQFMHSIVKNVAD